MSILHSRVRNVRLVMQVKHDGEIQSRMGTAHFVYVVPSSTSQIPLMAKPMSLDLHLKPTLNDGVPSKLRQRTLRKFVDLYNRAFQDRLGLQ